MYFKSKINPCFFIAEVGSAHEGSYKKALSLISSAIKTNTDVIKIQTYTAKNMVSDKFDPDRYKHFRKLELKNNQYISLLKKIKKSNKISCASIWDHEQIKYFNKYIDIYKVGSGDIHNFQIIKKLVRTKKPIIFSTGLCNVKDIKILLNFIKSIDQTYIDKKKIALLHCNTSYPTPEMDANLSNIELLKKFNLPIGYSDHCIGSKILFYSFLKGAQIIEKHFSNNIKLKSFRDHKISLDKNGVNRFLKKLKKESISLNKKKNNLSNSEINQNNIFSFRRSIYSKKSINKGELFTEKNIICLRHYIKKSNAKNFYNLVNKKKAKKNYKSGEII